MKQGVMVHIEKKCRNGVIAEATIINCEEQYVEFYIHCLESLGCEITKNTHNVYLDFIQYENVDISQDEIIKSWEEKKDAEFSYKNNPIITSLIYAAFGLLLGTVFYWGLR